MASGELFMYGHIFHPVTGELLAEIKDGTLTMSDGRTYKVDGNKVLSETGEVLAYLSVERAPPNATSVPGKSRAH